jgi:hypothetical protein
MQANKFPTIYYTAGQTILQKFNEECQQLCDLSHPDSFVILRKSKDPHWEEDWKFLQGQRKPKQEGTMLGIDKNFAAKESRKDLRRMECDQRRQAEANRRENEVFSYCANGDSADDCNSANDEDTEFTPPLRRQESQITLY